MTQKREMNSAEMIYEFKKRVNGGEYEEALRFIAPSIGPMSLQIKWKKKFRDAFIAALRVNYTSSNPKDLYQIGLVNIYIKSFKSHLLGLNLTNIDNTDIKTLKLACRTMHSMIEN